MARNQNCFFYFSKCFCICLSINFIDLLVVALSFALNTCCPLEVQLHITPHAADKAALMHYHR